MNLSFRKNTSLGLIVALGLILAIEAISVYVLLNQGEQARWVAHTYQVLQQFEDTVANLNEAESAERGFVITGEEFYLIEFQDKVKTINQNVREIRSLIKDNQAQIIRQNELENLILQKISFMTTIVEIRKNVGKNQAETEITQGLGKHLMNLIQEQIRRMESEERILLNDRTERAKNSSLLAVATFFTGTLLSILILFFIFRTLGKEMASRKLVEQSLSLSERKFHSIFDNISEGIFQISPSGQFITANPSMARILGFNSSEELIKDTEWTKKQLKISTKDLAVLKETLNNDNKIETAEIQLRRKDGISIWVSHNTYAVNNKSGNLLYFEGTLEDITEQKQIQLELDRAYEIAIESTRLKSEFLANMSHEIRTPMNGIIGMTEMLLSTSLSKDQREFVEVVRSSGDSLLTIIDEILDFSKIEAGKLNIENISFDIKKTVEEVISLFAPRAQDKGLELVLLIEQHFPEKVLGDQVRLRQVLLNLISNAIKFTEDGEVYLHATKIAETEKDLTLKFEVRDTGIGIPQEIQKNLFQPFTQADGTTTRKYGGTGLGLAISKKIVTLMNGEINVFSPVPGKEKGSVFWFTARFDKSPEGFTAISKSDLNANFEGLKVIIVDDNQTNRSILRHHTNLWGMKVFEAENAADALKLIREKKDTEPFDLAILDMQMPGMNGLELSRAIKEDPSTSSIKSVLLSSISQREYVKTISGSVVNSFLIKPVRQSQLFESISKVMGNYDFVRGEDIHTTYNPANLTIHRSIEPASSNLNKNFKVLVAEDDPTNRKVAERYLTKMGFDVELVTNGLEALNRIEKDNYDLILMDCQMPIMDGYQATKEIRQREQPMHHIPIIALTANAVNGDAEKCFAAGMDAYVPKPVKMKFLQEVIDQTLNQLKRNQKKENTENDYS